MSGPRYDDAYTYVSTRLRSELPPELTYHAARHTLEDVLPAAERLAELSGLSAEDTLVLRTAALYHDTGFIEAYEANEPLAVRLAAGTLGGFGYSAGQIERICAAILATRLPQQPHNLLEELMCDADLDSLGRDDFYITSFNLRLEFTLRGEVIPLRAWFIRQLDFLHSHQYFTPVARTLREPGKQARVREIKDLLGLM